MGLARRLFGAALDERVPFTYVVLACARCGSHVGICTIGFALVVVGNAIFYTADWCEIISAAIEAILRHNARS